MQGTVNDCKMEAPHLCVMVFSRPQKVGWGRGARPPGFFPFPPASVFMYFAFSPCTNTASSAQQRVFASSSSLVTKASEVTYCFCNPLIELTNCFLINYRIKSVDVCYKSKLT